MYHVQYFFLQFAYNKGSDTKAYERRTRTAL